MKKLPVIFALLLLVGVAGAQPPDYMVRTFGSKPGTYLGHFTNLTGSGVLVSKDLVLTNYHCVHRLPRDNDPINLPEEDKEWDAEEVLIGFTNSVTVRGKVVDTDPTWDLALVRIPAQTRSSLKLYRTEALQGDEVILHGWGPGFYATGPGKIKFWTGPDPKSDDEIKHHGWGAIEGVTARFGDSGGPITKDGRLYGLTRVIYAHHRFTGIVSLSRLKTFLKPHGIQ